MNKTYKKSKKTKRASVVHAPFVFLGRYSSARFKNNGIIWFIFAVLALVLVLTTYKLYQVQIIKGQGYRERVEYQHERTLGSQENKRGNIYMSYKDGGRLLAATDREYYQLVINNKNIRGKELKLRQALRNNIEYDQDLLEFILTKDDDPYEILVDRLAPSEVVYLQKNNIPGVELLARVERYYPLESLSSEAIGFVSFQDRTLRGTYGLEKYYDNILRRDGSVNNTSLLTSLFASSEEEEGGQDETSIEKHISKEGSLVTTLEPGVQEYLLTQLRSIDERFSSEYSAGIIMDPSSGKIVAMASTNAFDPNSEKQHYRNVTTEDRYEFGSIMKPLSVAMALDAGAIDENFSYNDKGHLVYNRQSIYNYDKQGRGPGTGLQEILAQSLNTGVATIAVELGTQKFLEYIDVLGLNSETGIDLPYEVYGITGDIETGRNIELATASYGQGIALTLIEMTRAWATLANDGVLQTPYLVSEIEYGDLIPAKNIPPGGNVRVFNSEVVDTVTDLLVNIVDDTTTFGRYSLPQHSIAIKTGTAQVADPEGGYYKDEFLHSFAGYFPAHAKKGEPRFVMVLFTFKPEGARYSSTTLKDAFFNTAEFLINYYSLIPDRNLEGMNTY